MKFIPAVKSAFVRAFDFRTRSSRSEYWYFALFNALVHIVLAAIWLPFAAHDAVSGDYAPQGFGVVIDTLSNVYGLVTVIPSIALIIRRLHDTSRSGWWLLVGIIPIIGWIALFVMACIKGDEEQNNWGENPLRDSAADGS